MAPLEFFKGPFLEGELRRQLWTYCVLLFFPCFDRKTGMGFLPYQLILTLIMEKAHEDLSKVYARLLDCSAVRFPHPVTLANRTILLQNLVCPHGWRYAL